LQPITTSIVQLVSMPRLLQAWRPAKYRRNYRDTQLIFIDDFFKQDEPASQRQWIRELQSSRREGNVFEAQLKSTLPTSFIRTE
jgi:hypothetical protein